MTITYENAAEKLVEHVPELAEAYRSELKWWGNQAPGAHVVYGDILSPHIDRLLRAGDEMNLRRVFAFLEDLAQSEDKRVQELVAVTVCEHLGTEADLLSTSRHYMGPATLKLSRDVEKFWG